MRMCWLCFVCSAIALVVCLPATAKHFTRPNLTTSHVFVKALQPQHAEITFSPDKQYKAKLRFESDGDRMLNVFQRDHSGKYKNIWYEFEYVNGFLWLPGHPHTLVWATCGGFDGAGISLFNGENTYQLKRAKRPYLDCYRCYGYLIHSHEIVYGYSEHYLPQFTKTAVDAAEARLKKRHYMYVK